MTFINRLQMFSVERRERCGCECATGLLGTVVGFFLNYFFYSVWLVKQDGGMVGSQPELHVQECVDFGAARKNNSYDSCHY